MPRKNSITRRNRAVAQDNKDTRVQLYTRVSTDKQDNSLAAQKSIAASFATSRSLIIDDTVVDNDSSAVKVNFLDRQKVRTMLSQMKARNIRTILILRPDRIFRSTFDYAISIKWLRENGYNLRFIENDVDLDSPAAAMMVSVLVAFAEMECKLRSQRVDEGLDTLREQRIARSNNPTYGWALTDEIAAYSKKSQGKNPLYRLTPIQHEQTILRHILNLWDSQEKKHGLLTAISVELNALAIPTKMAGQPMTKNGRTFICSGTWAPATVKSVIEHAVIATPEELPEPNQTLEQAIQQITTTTLAA